MTVKFSVTTKPTFRDLKGRFAKADEKLIAIRRDELRSEGPEIVKIVRSKLKKKTAPYSSEKLAQGVRFNTRGSSESIRLSITVPQKAGPHRIYAKNKAALAFNWPKFGGMTFVPKNPRARTHVRNGQLWIGKGYVDHPGGTLVPFFTPILQNTHKEWERGRGRIVLNRISTRYASEVTK